MTRQPFRPYLFLLVCFSISVTATAQTVDIPDPYLRAAIEAELGKASGTTITVADMANLTELEAPNTNITDLTGLEHATNLTELHLGVRRDVGRIVNSNSISDISPLAGLTQLTKLDLGSNNISDISPLTGLNQLTTLNLVLNSISDISPLAGLTQLTTLDLEINSISDISPLEGLTNLTHLGLSYNSISDISPLEGLTNLTHLGLSGNSISDISPLEGLTNLRFLPLSGNSIADISPLVANTGLGNGDRIHVRGNPLSDASINTHIPALVSRGVTVEFDPSGIPDPNLRAAIEAELGKASGDTITANDMATLTRLEAGDGTIDGTIFYLTGLERATNLTFLDLDNNFIDDISPLAGLTRLTDLRLPGAAISDLSPLAGLNNLTYLDLSANFVISDISPLAGLTNLTTLVLHNNSIADISPLVANTGLGKGDQIDVSENPLSDASINTHMPALINRGVTVEFNGRVFRRADIPDPNLRAAIEAELGKASGATITTNDMKTLRILLAPNANISDLAGLEHATNLTELNLGAVEEEEGFINSNSVSDISPLAGLTLLTKLGLGNNSIANISPLAGLTLLRFLGLWENSISDLSPLTGLTRLTDLRLRTNNITNLSPLAGLTNLTWLDLGNNSISDISHLEGLTNLTTLNLEINSISDISHLAGLTRLTTLDLEINSISDISPLAGLTYLSELGLLDNSISDISPLAGLTHLTFLGLGSNNISDLSPLVDLFFLRKLGLRANNITDISHLEGLTNLTTLNLEINSISDISPLVANTGLGNGDTVYLSVNPLNSASINTHIPALVSRGVEVYFGDIVIEPETVDIPDPNLRAAIEAKLGKASGATIATNEMATLTILLAPNANISDLTGLEHATNLTHLRLDSNSVSDLSPLAGLTNLTHLGLDSNSVSDVSPLTGLTNLTFLDLDHNSIADISPLVANTGLGNGDEVAVSGNPLNSTSINTHIPTLVSRGVTVYFGDIVIEPETVDIPDPNLRAAIEAKLGKASGTAITADEMATLTILLAPNANISDLTGLEHATNLRALNLGDVEVEGGFINSNSVSDLSPLAGLTRLTKLGLENNSIANISPLAGLTNLTDMEIGGNKITDVSSLAGLTKLTLLWLNNNSIADISPLTGLTNLKTLVLENNSISDISPLAGLTNLTQLRLYINPISDISPLAGLTKLTSLGLGRNNISDISPLAGLTNLTTLTLWTNSISDLSPLVANTGLGKGDRIDVSENPLNSASINTHIPALQRRGVEVYFENLKPTTPEYLLSIPAGISLIHVPLKVTTVDGVPKTIESISNLYDALGGASKVNFLITYDSQAQEWRSYFGASDTGTPADRVLTDDMGITAGMIAPASISLSGSPLGTNGSGTITINPGLNLVGLPLNDSGIKRVSALFALEGIGGNVPVIILTDGGEFKVVGRAGDPGDIPIVGGQAFIMTAQRAATVTISGDGWTNTSGTAAAPPLSLTGIEVGDTTPVLGLRGAIVDQGTGVNQVGLRVTVKNLSTRRAVAAVTGPDEAGYRLAVVDIETGRAATIGDTLEISAQSPNPFIGVKPLRYTVTAEDVKQSLIQLPELVAYEIPAETELLHNYPNPFNPETWIPYRLAEDAFVTLTIYDQTGQIVRTLDVGHQIASVYENRSRAIYWDGRNDVGEQVASGVYFYHLFAGDYSATRKMLILK